MFLLLFLGVLISKVELCIQRSSVLLNKTGSLWYIRVKLQFSADNDANVHSSNSTVSS